MYYYSTKGHVHLRHNVNVHRDTTKSVILSGADDKIDEVNHPWSGVPKAFGSQLRFNVLVSCQMALMTWPM